MLTPRWKPAPRSYSFVIGQHFGQHLVCQMCSFHLFPFLLLFASCSPEAATEGELTVRLEEVGFETLPESFRPTGAVASSGGRIVLWSLSDSSALFAPRRCVDSHSGGCPTGGWLPPTFGGCGSIGCERNDQRVCVVGDLASQVLAPTLHHGHERSLLWRLVVCP